MSRQVPLDQPLSDVDRRYLRHLGAQGAHLERRLDTEFPPDPEALAAFDKAERQALAAANGTGLTNAEQDRLRDENAQLKAELEALRASTPPPADDEPADYSSKEWTKAALEAEVDRINAEDPDAKLPKGTKDEMAAALTAYFAE